jgi:transketolase
MNERLKEILIKKGLTHVGSCDTAYNGISAVYDIKKPDEKFILSNGHAGVALYTVLEQHGLGNVEDLYNKCGTHPDRLADKAIDCSTGSLGQGLPIAIGMALANKEKMVYCMISDGECAEGSIWESLSIIQDLDIKNMKILVNVNGWGAYRKINVDNLCRKISSFVYLTSICEDNKEDILRKLDYSQVVIIKTHSELKNHYEKITV